MGQLIAGLSGSYGKTNSNTDQSQFASGNATNQNQYRPEQDSLQVDLANLFRSMLPGMASGTLSPNVQAQKTASADTINQNYAGLTDRVDKFLAQRGFGKSGTAGKVGLQAELGRQGDLAGNEAKYAGVQDAQNSGFLSDALQSAYSSLGQSGFYDNLNRTLTRTEGSGYGISAGIGTKTNG